MSSSSQPFYPYQTGFFMPTAVQGPYNAMPYGSTWVNHSLPLSNYSSLNGATSANPSTSISQPQQSQHQQQQEPSSPQPMMIEWVSLLFSMNHLADYANPALR
jgi:protein phosphatase 1 regulatory subunit 10